MYLNEAQTEALFNALRHLDRLCTDTEAVCHELEQLAASLAPRGRHASADSYDLAERAEAGLMNWLAAGTRHRTQCLTPDSAESLDARIDAEGTESLGSPRDLRLLPGGESPDE
jgi:hypothetical protein